MDAGSPQRSVDPDHPWLGLDSFSEETKQFFHGREEEVAELARRVQRALLTILFGQSGLGKTSILRAGLVPRLRGQGYCPVYVRIDYAESAPSPSEQIKQAIFRATQSLGQWTKPGVAVEGESLWEFLHHRDDLLHDANGRTIVPMLIFDQFEEIFTIAQSDDAGRKRAQQFIEDLADLVENRAPAELEARLESDDSLTERFDFARSDYRILIALREDYLANLEGLKRQMPSITQNRIRLARMNGAQALDAVLKPGARLVSQEVAESIVRFVAGGSELRNAEVEPSLLSLICRELNNARIAQGRPEISADLLAGSHDTILAEFYERALADQPSAVRKVIEDQLLTESGFRENLAEERVLKAFAEAGAGPEALATLVNRRLLRIEERLDVRRVELTHDVLCGVVRASRQVRREREQLEEAERQLAAQREREEATRMALVRTRRVALVCAVLAAGAVVGAAFGFYSMNRARSAEADALAARQLADTSRGEAEKLVAFLLDDFYDELAPVGRLEAVGSLARSAVAYYKELPPELRTPDTLEHEAQARVRLATVLIAQGAIDEAGKVIDGAEQIAASLPQGAGGDRLLTAAIVRGAKADYLDRRSDLPGALKAYRDAAAFLSGLPKGVAPSARTKLLQLQLQLGTGRIQSRMSDPAAKDTLLAAQAFARELKAHELTDLRATMLYIATLQQYATTLYFNVGDTDGAIKSARESGVLAEKVVAMQPDHRPAIRAQASAAGLLGRIDYDNLHLTPALANYRQVSDVRERLTRLDPTNTILWMDLCNIRWGVANMLRDMARLEEGEHWLEQSVVVPSRYKIDPSAARFMLIPAGTRADWYLNKGDTAKAEAAIRDFRRFATLAKSGNDSDFFVDVGVATWEARFAFVAGKYEEARTMVRQVLDKGRNSKSLQPMLQPGWDQNLDFIVYSSSMALGDYPAAEAAVRSYIQSVELSKIQRTNYLVLGQYNGAKVELAIALARQGKLQEAQQILKPLAEFFRSPEVVKGEDNEAQVYRTRFFLAYGLAFPAERRERLQEAHAAFQARPAAVRTWKYYKLTGDEIARELAKN